jgi:transposase
VSAGDPLHRWSTNEGTVQMIVIGADTHKGSHALAAVEEGTGRVRGSRQIKADEAGHLAAVRWARSLDGERVWAIEDCRHVSRRLEQALLAAGESVVRVAPHRMGASRKGEREPGKSDEIDALAVARAVVKDGVESFPVAFLDERAMEIRLLLDHRSDLVAERTRTVNRLRWHLLELCGELEASLKRKALNQPRSLTGSTAGCGRFRPVHAGGSRAHRSPTCVT